MFTETLRITPTPFLIFKTCAEDYTLKNSNGNDFLIEKGTKIQIPTYSIHMDPKYYTDPFTFNPERFDERNGGVKFYVDQGIFLPFGNGPRICLGKLTPIIWNEDGETMRFFLISFFTGKQLAITQIKAAVATLVKNYNITTDAPKGIKYRNNYLFVFKPRDIKLFFREAT